MTVSYTTDAKLAPTMFSAIDEADMPTHGYCAV